LSIIDYALKTTTDFSNIDALANRLDDFIGMPVGKPKITEEINGEYISSNRLKELTNLKSDEFDLSALKVICNEINNCYDQGDYLATSLLIRTLLNHIPKVFGFDTFSEVANNYPFPRSLKGLIMRLQTDLRDIADVFAHFQIDKHIILPDKNQVQFQHNLDILLQYLIIEIKKKQEPKP
jgi:hypothetical protein